MLLQVHVDLVWGQLSGDTCMSWVSLVSDVSCCLCFNNLWWYSVM